MIAENSKEVNIWEEKAKQCKARRALAQSRGLTVESISLKDVTDSPGGLEYWANISITLEANASAKPKAKAKAKAKADDGGNGKSLANLEKTLKTLVAHEMVIKKGTEELKESKQAAPEKWAWAASYFADCATKEEVVLEIKKGGFIAKFMTSALSPETMKKLKKETGDEYYNEVLRAVDALKTPISEWASTIARINAMADAAGLVGTDASSDAGTEKKKKAKK